MIRDPHRIRDAFWSYTLWDRTIISPHIKKEAFASFFIVFSLK